MTIATLPTPTAAPPADLPVVLALQRVSQPWRIHAEESGCGSYAEVRAHLLDGRYVRARRAGTAWTVRVGDEEPVECRSVEEIGVALGLALGGTL